MHSSGKYVIQVETTQNKLPIIRSVYSSCGKSVESKGWYIGRDDKRKEYYHNGNTEVNKRNIERMQNAGYDFMHVICTTAQ